MTHVALIEVHKTCEYIMYSFQNQLRNGLSPKGDCSNPLMGIIRLYTIVEEEEVFQRVFPPLCLLLNA